MRADGKAPPACCACGYLHTAMEISASELAGRRSRETNRTVPHSALPGAWPATHPDARRKVVRMLAEIDAAGWSLVLRAERLVDRPLPMRGEVRWPLDRQECR
jgi:hypothetical protein